ncbi:MAG: hypothetical protein WDO56_19820 [Gammaproteobacteria bacterium]
MIGARTTSSAALFCAASASNATLVLQHVAERRIAVADHPEQRLSQLDRPLRLFFRRCASALRDRRRDDDDGQQRSGGRFDGKVDE